jgi:hypothetical protein
MGYLEQALGDRFDIYDQIDAPDPFPGDPHR